MIQRDQTYPVLKKQNDFLHKKLSMPSSPNESEQNNSPYKLFIKDFIAGTGMYFFLKDNFQHFSVAGWAQVLVGQPFDTIKVTNKHCLKIITF